MNVITVEAYYWTVTQRHGVRFVICIELHVWSLAGLYVRQSTKTFFLDNYILCSFFCCCSPAASRKVYPIMNHCEHKVHLVEHGIDSACKVFISFILAM